MSTAIDDAWSELQAATPPGWHVGRPAYDERREAWEQHAFDPRERAKAGVRSRRWTRWRPPSTRWYARWRGASG